MTKKETLDWLIEHDDVEIKIAKSGKTYAMGLVCGDLHCMFNVTDPIVHQFFQSFLIPCTDGMEKALNDNPKNT